jgi:branched-chain amino acid transport system substrate-binding protein
MRVRARDIALVVTCLLVVCACTQQPHSKDTVTVGVLLPLSGTRAEAGEHIRAGLALAQHDIDRNDSKKYQIRFTYADTQYNPALAVSGVRKIIALENISYVIGPYGSSEVLAVAPLTEQARIILISPSAQATGISSAGDYVFRTQVTTDQEADVLAPFIAKRIGGKRLEVIAINTDYSPSFLAGFTDNYSKAGGEIGLVQYFHPGDADFRTQLLKAQADGGDALLLLSTAKEAGLLVRQSSELQTGLPIFATSPIETAEFLKAAGVSAEGVVYPYPFDAQSEDAAQHGFQRKHLQAYGRESEMLGANGYDALMLLSSCLEREGDDPARVKECLYGTKEYHGASGVLTFDRNGDVRKPFIMKTVRDGRFVKLE